MTKETVVLKIDSETKRILLRLTKALERFNPVEPTALSDKGFEEIPLDEVTRKEGWG